MDGKGASAALGGGAPAAAEKIEFKFEEQVSF